MRRIGIAAVLALTLVCASRAASQQQGKMYGLGILTPSSPPTTATSHDGLPYLIELLRVLGYVEGQNLKVEWRYAGGRSERLAALAADLVDARVSAILAVSATAVQAAKGATQTIPIVMGFASDPVGRGFVASLARPGGNITGVSYWVGPELEGKRLEQLKRAVPSAARIAVLVTNEPHIQGNVQGAQKIALSLGVKLITVEVRGAEYGRAFATAVAERAEALLVAASPILSRDRKEIIALAAKHRLPALCEWSESVEEGCLLAYGSSNRALYRRVAAYIDRIFKGENPAELPVEQPTLFELIINLKTAKTLGLTIPQSVLLRADQVIE